MDALAATGRVRVCDLKALYVGTPVDTAPDAAFHRLIADRFPDAVLEDTSLEPDVLAALDGRRSTASRSTRRSTRSPTSTRCPCASST